MGLKTTNDGFIPAVQYKEIIKKLPIPCVDVVLVDPSMTKILLPLRTEEPAEGKIWFPGGRVRLGETLQDAVIRIIGTEVDPHAQVANLTQVGTTQTVFPVSAFGKHYYHTINTIYAGILMSNQQDIDWYNILPIDTDYYVRFWYKEAYKRLKEDPIQ